MTNPEALWRPTARQRQFLASRADEALYGGAAGGGKSVALLACPLRWIDNPRFRGLYLRREATYLGDAIDKAAALYPALGATLVRTPRVLWTFPSGATIWMGHCAHEDDARNFDSFEFSYVAFDELTHFTERQYLAIRARLRGTDPALPFISRAGTNPGGPGHEWVFARWAPWLDPAHPVRAATGERLWFDGAEVVPRGAPHALSRTFVPALLSDNPHVAGDYEAQLRQLDVVRRAQLLAGDWLKKPAPKDYWDRDRVTHLDHAPADAVARVRCWDFGATTDGDWTVGVKAALTREGVVVVEHVTRFRGPPDRVRAEFKRVAAEDRKADVRTGQWIPEDPGQAGKDQVRSYQNDNPGVAINARRPTGDKLVRFAPASARAMAGNLAVVRGSWNGPLHDELEGLPETLHDDQADALADAVAVLTGAAIGGPVRTVRADHRHVYG
jgi:predicted phage terminase large subunit-like protein